jgi:hypothetical protein
VGVPKPPLFTSDSSNNKLTGTQEVRSYLCQPSSPSRVWLVDTPGFDDSLRSEVEILEEIAAWLAREYKQQAKLRGIIYLHAITANRMTGSAKRNLHMFKQLCGPDAFSRIILASTMWEDVSQSAGAKRELQLKENPEVWGHMIANGSKLTRHSNTPASAMAIVKNVLQASSKEIVDQGRSLQQTEAGKAVQSLLAEEREKMEAKIAEIDTLRKNDKKANSEEKRRLRDEMARNEERQNRLRRTEMRDLLETHERRISEMARKNEAKTEEAERKANLRMQMAIQDERRNYEKQRAQERAISEKKQSEARKESRKILEQERALYKKQAASYASRAEKSERENRRQQDQQRLALEGQVRQINAMRASSEKEHRENEKSRKEAEDWRKQFAANKTATKLNDNPATAQPSRVSVPTMEIPKMSLRQITPDSPPFVWDVSNSSVRLTTHFAYTRAYTAVS